MIFVTFLFGKPDFDGHVKFKNIRMFVIHVLDDLHCKVFGNETTFPGIYTDLSTLSTPLHRRRSALTSLY